MSIATAKERLRLLGESWDANQRPRGVSTLLVAGAALAGAHVVRRRITRRRGESVLGRVLSAAVVLRVARIAAPMVVQVLSHRLATKRCP